MSETLSAADARRFLVDHHRLRRPARAKGTRGIERTFESLGCIQLDPLDPIGTNADLVALARVDGAKKGDVYRAALEGRGFEHFAKERCLLPARAFPQYRERAVQTPWWRLTERSKRVPAAVLEDVLTEVAERGPATSAELTDHGSVEALDWSGWKGTGRMTTMALEILWTRCRVVVCARRANGDKVYDIPARALPEHHDAPAQPFARWALLERVASAGLLARAGGPCWSMLRDVRTSTLPDELIEEGTLVEVRVEGSRRPYLAPGDLAPRLRRRSKDDSRMRILAPLDPMIWDRKLVKQAFDFEYLWEVYKPAEKRRWGWYVCPLLHAGTLVGRLEARVVRGALEVQRLWREADELDEDALDAALARHAEALGLERVRRGRRARRR